MSGFTLAYQASYTFVNDQIPHTLYRQVTQLFTKENPMGFGRRFLKIGVLLIAVISMSACVIRPIGWGGGHGRGEYRHYDSDHGYSHRHDDSRDDSRRRGP
jgi:hypothetical protein